MQNTINQFFLSLFYILNNFLETVVADVDPGTRWGLAIIVFTLLFNIILFPLNQYSMKSTRKMSLVQPELKKIQERYKNDPARLQAAQQKFMKDNKVSMWGGCLPMLIQWPLFIALFSIFRQLADEGIITGLSFLPPLVSDLGATGNIPLTVLVVVTMLLSTWLQQKANEKNMTEDAKKQQKQMNNMMYIMSLMIGWFTWSSPAALGLYWGTNNIFRIAQQALTEKISGDAGSIIIPAEIPDEPTTRKRNKVIRK